MPAGPPRCPRPCAAALTASARSPQTGDPGEVAGQRADEDVDVERGEEPGEHGVGGDRGPPHAGGEPAAEDRQQHAEDEARDERADDREQGREPAAVAGGQRPQVLHERRRAGARGEADQRLADGLRRRRAQGLGHEDAVARGLGDDHPAHVGVQQRRARGRRVAVAAYVEAAGNRCVECALRPRRLRGRPHEPDVDAPGARCVEGRDVERREAEQQHEAGEDDAGRRAGVGADGRVHGVLPWARSIRASSIREAMPSLR